MAGLWPVVVPRSVLRLLQFGLVGLSTSFQLSDSIIKGPEARNYPRGGTGIGALGSSGLQGARGLSTRCSDSGIGKSRQMAYCLWRVVSLDLGCCGSPRIGRRNLPLSRGLRRDFDGVTLAGGVRVARLSAAAVAPAAFWYQCRRVSMVSAAVSAESGRAALLPASMVRRRGQRARSQATGWGRTRPIVSGLLWPSRPSTMLSGKCN
jgi:hypothetical protein